MVRERRIRVAYTAIGIGLIVGLASLWDVPLRFSLSAGLWFEILVLALLAGFIVEPYFSGAPASLVNSVSVFFIAIAASFKGPAGWWIALVVVEGLSVVLLLLELILRDPDAPTDALGQRAARVAKQVGVVLGSWRFALLAALVLALATFVPPFEDPWRISLIVVLYLLGTIRLQPHRLLDLLRGKPSEPDLPLGAVRVSPPAEILVVGEAVDSLLPGALFKVEGSGRKIDAIALGATYVKGGRAFRLLAPDLSRLLHREGFEALRFAAAGDQDVSELAYYREELGREGVRALGTVSDGSSMLEMVVELSPEDSVSLGQLLWTTSAQTRTYWQVADARIEQKSWAGDNHRAVVVRASQLGHWDQVRYAFEADVVSPPHTALALSGVDPGPEGGDLPDGYHSIGLVPNSGFPVAIDLREFALHHAAVLGTTGTGKTHLTFDLASAMSNAGIKVICVDTTGQYGRRFPAAESQHIVLNQVGNFLDGASTLAVYTPDPNQHTITEGKALANTVFQWAKGQPPMEPGDLARCVIIFEEAQNFVPEQFVVDDWGLKATAQDTSRIIMESRKFGLGFVLVSQRTAMVTKSALSQCNTVVAFQAVDQTGLDYLEGICGSSLARGIPTLPIQTAISMGRGMASGRPVIVRITDANVVVT